MTRRDGLSQDLDAVRVFHGVDGVSVLFVTGVLCRKTVTLQASYAETTALIYARAV